MSLARLALRLAAVETLAPFAARATGGPYPTVAGANVYDSRLDPIAAEDEWSDFLSEIEGKPLVTVFTEEHETEPKPGSNYPAGEDLVELVVELMIAARGEIEVEGPAGAETIGAVGVALSDRQREALLDLLEAQIRNLLDTSQGPTTGVLWKKTAWEVRRIHSVPQREGQGASRIAARTCKFKAKVRSDEWPELPDSTAPAGLAVLPQPLLSVALALDPASSAGILCAELAALIGQPAAAPAINQIRLDVNINRGPAATPSAAGVANETASTDIAGAWTGPAFSDDFDGTE